MGGNGSAGTVWDEVGWTAPPILTEGNQAKAEEFLLRYFGPDRTGHRERYSGAMFNELGGGGDRQEVKDTFTIEDFAAVSMLSVDVPATHALQLLGNGVTARGLEATNKWREELGHNETFSWAKIPSIDHIPIDAEQVNKALARVPVNVELAKVEEDEIEDLLTCVDLLWREVRRKGVLVWESCESVRSHSRSLGETTTSKLLARKRPHLLPVIDSVVKNQLLRDGGRSQRNKRKIGFYRSMWEVMSDAELRLPEHLNVIREAVYVQTGDERIRRLSDLRVFDIVVWMYAKNPL